MAGHRENLVFMEDSLSRRLDVLHRHFSPSISSEKSLQVNQCSNSSLYSGAPVVIGSMVLDIHALPFTDGLRPGTTTPGKVRYARGGVGRNVAECMSKLGLDPFFISVVGQDMAGDLLLAHWQSLGIKTDGIRCCSEASTPVVSAIFDEKGELAGAVADINTLEKYLTSEWISQFQSHIRCASVLMLDANLSDAALQTACKLAAEARVPIWFEPVSVSKSVRHKTISKYLTFVSPNEAELVAMAMGEDCKLENAIKHSYSHSDMHSLIPFLQPHIERLLKKGIKFVVLTLGGLGVILCSQLRHLNAAANNDYWLPAFKMAVEQQLADNQLSAIGYLHFPALPASVVSLSGAGDCFVAGALSALWWHQGLFASMAFGIAVAKQAVQSEFNVPSTMSEVNLLADAQNVLSKRQLYTSQ